MTTKGVDLAWAFARIFTGLIMAYHGSQKAFGAFGGNGLEATINGFEQGLGIPPVLTLCAIAGELLGGLGLVAGALTRIAGFGVFSTMVVAMMVNLNKAEGGFGAYFTGASPDEMGKVSYTLLMAMVGLGCILGGAGKYSFDYKFKLEDKVKFLKKDPD